MIKRDQTGAINGLLLALIAVSVLFVVALVFAFWAYGGRQDYKNNSDIKAAAAAEVAKQTESAAKDKEFAEIQKSPYKTYVGPSAYGSVSVTYPKTWSGYVRDTGNSSPFIDGYFSPNVVPDVSNAQSTYALRIQVVQDSYSSVLSGYNRKSDNPTKIEPYKLPKVGSIIGSKITGEVENDKQGEMIILPVRDKTLKVWTNSNDYISDLETIILPNLTFAP